jgi:hypothetical protein
MKTRQTEYTCDRCGATAVVKNDNVDHPLEWRKLWVSKRVHDIQIRDVSESTLAVDLCPKCVAALGRWVMQEDKHGSLVETP